MLKNLFESGITYQQEFDKSQEEHKEKALNYMENMVISEPIIEQVKNINKEVNILGFSELWCADCQINASVMNYLTQLNPNINLKLVSLKGNEEIIKQHSDDGNVKIPIFLMLDENYEKVGDFIEVPSNVRKVEHLEDQVQRILIKKEYRKGKYMEQTVLDFLDAIK